MIRRTYLYYLILIAVSATIFGCHGQERAQALDTVPVAKAGPNARAYYYYMVSQIKLKQSDIPEAIWYLKQATEHCRDSSYLKIELANLYLIEKEDQESLALIQQVLAKEPSNVQALTIAGRIYQQQKKMDKAIEAYEKVLLSQPSEQGVYLVLGRIYWNNNNFNDAERVFEQMTVNIPESYAAYFFYGKALAAQGKLASAEKALLKSIKLEWSLEEPRLELLKIYESQNQLHKIPTVYKAILDNDPGNFNAAFGLAEHYRKSKKNTQSLEILADLGHRIEHDERIISTLFDRYLEAKHYPEAAWMLKGMLTSAPHNSALHYMTGIAFNGMEQDDKALVHMLKVKPDSRFYTNAVVHSAMIYHDQGKIDHAIALVQKAIVHTPDNIDYYLYLGSFYEELERFDEAVNALQIGLQKDDRNGRLHFRIGVIFDKMGQKDKSIAAMKNVLELSPNDAEALNYLGYTYADMGIHLDEAEILIRTALSIKPNDGYITDSLGWVYFKWGRYRQALEWLSKAVKLIPDDPVILEHLGDVYLKMDSKEKALNYYQQSLKKKTTGLGPLEKKIRTLIHP